MPGVSNIAREEDWENEGGAHLRDDAPFVVCHVCARHSWGNSPGDQCNMPQPSGGKCVGLFGPTQRPDLDTHMTRYRRALERLAEQTDMNPQTVQEIAREALRINGTPSP